MAESYGALCTDFYVNQMLALKMDVPGARDTVLSLFDRVRRSIPRMDRLRRYEGELALESAESRSAYSWLAMRRTSIRTGWVNPTSLEQAYELHRLILDVAPYFLSISPLDVEYIELIFGFDLEAATNRDEVVFSALLADSPLAGVFDAGRESVLDAQPLIGFTLTRNCELQAFVEIRTRTRASEIASGHYDRQPISVYLTVRRSGAVPSLEELSSSFGALAGHIERLADERILPHVVMPIRQAIQSQPG